MKRVELEPSFVLHHRPYRETSLLVEALGRDTGRLGLIAKGARRPKSDLRGLLQPFRPLLLSWSGSGELGLLTAAEPHGYVRGLGGKALFSGFYMNELLMRLLHRFDPHAELFHHYQAALEALARGGRSEAVLRVFEKQMLESIGYGLVLDHDIESGEPIDAEATYSYERERGPVLLCDGASAASASDRHGGRECGESSGTIPACVALARSSMDSDGVCIGGDTLLALAAEDIDGERALDEAKRLMRVVLRGYLGDKPLATRTLFRPSSQAPRTSPGMDPAR